MATLNQPFGLFSDEVFSSTDLNRRLGEVLNRARKNPVTIARNNERFALVKREHAATLVRGIKQMADALNVVRGDVALRKNRPDAVPAAAAWMKAFDEEDRLSMLEEILDGCIRASTDDAADQWENVGDLIHQWRESAAVVESGVLRDAMAAEVQEQEITDPNVGLDEPRK